MDGLDQDPNDQELLPLAVAAAQTYHRVMGAAPEPRDARHHEAILNCVAHALTNVTPIYVLDGSGLRQVVPVELIQADLSRGATVLRLKDGTELHRPAVRRADLGQAVAILKGAKVRFDV